MDVMSKNDLTWFNCEDYVQLRFNAPTANIVQ